MIESGPPPSLKQVSSSRRQQGIRHYHLVENHIGNPLGYRDEVFSTRRQAGQVARIRVQWLAAAGRHVEAITVSGPRYLVTRPGARDPGCLIQVEECEDAGCLENNRPPR